MTKLSCAHSLIALLVTQALWVPTALSASLFCSSPVKSTSCDIVIVDSSLGGVAAALKASAIAQKAHKTVCMSSMTDWIGGQLSTQAVSAIDVSGDGEFEKFSAEKIQNRQLTCFAPARAHMKLEASNWLTPFTTTPANANAALQLMLKPYIDTGTLKVFCNSVPVKVVSSPNKDQIQKIKFVHRIYTGQGSQPYAIPLSSEIEDWYNLASSKRYDKANFWLAGQVFIDGSDTGELTALSQSTYDIGSPKDDGLVSASVFPILLENRKLTREDSNFLTKQASGYEAGNNPAYDVYQTSRGRSMGAFFQKEHGGGVWRYRSLPKTQTGGLDMTLMNWEMGNDGYDRSEVVILDHTLSEAQIADWRGGLDIEALHKLEQRAYSFTDFLNKNSEIKSERFGGFKGAAPVWSSENSTLATPSPFGTATALSRFPYIRESRRMKTLTELTSSQIEAKPGHPFTHFGDALGIANYAMDSRLRLPDGHPPYRPTRLYQFRLSNITSVQFNNLLAASKNLGMDQNVASSLRTHLAEWAVGAAAGTTAATAVKHQLSAHSLASTPTLVAEVQNQLIEGGCPIHWTENQPPKDRCVRAGEGSVCCTLARSGPSDLCSSGDLYPSWKSCSLPGLKGPGDEGLPVVGLAHSCTETLGP